MKKKWKKTLLYVGLIVLIIAPTLHFISKSRSFQFFGEIYNRIETQEKLIALTFDDGPTVKTDTILSILEKHEIKGTFFLNGRGILNAMQETKAIVRAGHEIGNHSYSHDVLLFKPMRTIEYEIEKTDSLIREAGYTGNNHFRPPYGKKLFTLPYYLKQNNRKTIMWDIEPESFPEVSSSSESIAQYVVDHAKNGSIILLHLMFEANKHSLEALEPIIENLKEREYKFVTVSELLTYQ